MTIKFTVSAPGKVILNGEHSVVYNKPALAGVIGLRNYVTLTENTTESVIVNFDLFSKGSIKLPLLALNTFLAEIQSEFNTANFPDEMVTLHDEYLAKVQKFVRNNDPLTEIDKTDREESHRALSAIVYLISAIEATFAASNNTQAKLTKGFTLDFKSQVPTNAGLGSSAAFAVCIAATFYTYSLTHSTKDFVHTFNKTATIEEQTFFKSTVSAWAFLSERIMHGTPSGLDNTICTFGNVVQFMKNPKKIIDVDLKAKINIMLVNSGVNRNTLEVVRKVAKLRDEHGPLIDGIMNAMGLLVSDVVNILENAKADTEMETYEKLKRLFSINNNLLRALDVSHPVLEEIFSIAERLGFAVKLTGAGAGGYAIILLPPSYADDEKFQTLLSNIKGFASNVTTIGGTGLQIAEENIE